MLSLAISLVLSAVSSEVIVYSFSTSTNRSVPAATSSEFNIAAAGDWDCNSNTKETVDNIVERNPEVVLGLGDYIYYEKSADCWLDIVEPLKQKMKIIIGNHETKVPTILNQIVDDFEIDYFGVGGQYYYSFDYHNVHFIVMSDYAPNSSEESLQTYREGSKQYNFVKNDLAESSADPQIDWIIVSHHIQQYASTRDEEVPSVDEWPKIYHPLFAMYNVDLVLQGHQHNYQRTYPIKYNMENPEKPIITDGNKNSYTSRTGQIFVTAGTAGAALQDLEGIAPYIVTQHVGFGFINISLIDDGATLNAKFYNNDGTVKDEFTITK